MFFQSLEYVSECVLGFYSAYSSLFTDDWLEYLNDCGTEHITECNCKCKLMCK